MTFDAYQEHEDFERGAEDMERRARRLEAEMEADKEAAHAAEEQAMTTHERIGERLKAAGFETTVILDRCRCAWVEIRMPDGSLFVLGDNAADWGADFYPSDDAYENGDAETGFNIPIPSTSDDDFRIAQETIGRIHGFMMARSRQ